MTKSDENFGVHNNDNSINNFHVNPGFLPDSDTISSSTEKPNNEIINAKSEKEPIPEKIDTATKTKVKDPQLWRDLLGFWLLGLCNNYGYVVMLSAAHDIIGKFDKSPVDVNTPVDNDRECHIMSTGTILLADILPSLFIKFLAPFFPFWVNVRVFCAIFLSVAGFLLVGFAEYQWMALFGVVCTSLSSGLGETTFLAYSSRFNKNVVSTWASGTGGSGVSGSLSYAALRAAGISPLTTMLIMLVVPGLEVITFWVILRNPKKNSLLPSTVDTSQNKEEKENTIENAKIDHEQPLKTLKDKLFYILYLLRYMIPLTTVYLAEYFINQGLFELVYFANSSMDKGEQYRWLNVVYQIGVFISRSSVNLYSIEKIWIFAVFQLVNVVYFLNEVIFYITPNIWIVFAVVLFEGLLGGGAYVNTYYKMSKDIPKIRRQFALGFVATSDAIGITIAGFIAMPVHNAICLIPQPVRL